jgi:hypothetical protein
VKATCFQADIGRHRFVDRIERHITAVVAAIGASVQCLGISFP